MDRLYSPWRYQYVTGQTPAQGCVFCAKVNDPAEDALIVHRAELNYVVVNLYPYASGHILVVPYSHVGALADCPDATAAEMMQLVRIAEGVLREVYRAPGFNIGMNIGACAGAGVAGHIHMHMLPRWPGDANFLTTTGETRVLPEEVIETARKIRAAWPDSR
ncbi:MAG: HIT domain-containing protein [Bryobacteraceae bacterium]